MVGRAQGLGVTNPDGAHGTEERRQQTAGLIEKETHAEHEGTSTRRARLPGLWDAAQRGAGERAGGDLGARAQRSLVLALSEAEHAGTAGCWASGVGGRASGRSGRGGAEGRNNSLL